MGLGTNKTPNDDDDVVIHDTGGGGKSFGSVPCSICLEVVADNGDRSWAKLQCGHQFHLDCIGSAFNIKGAMQCPNCRKIEKGQWLYSNGSRSVQEFNMEDWTHDEDLYDLSYSEMSVGVHWCPFGSLTRLPSSFEEGEFSSTAYNDLLGQHAILADHQAAVSSSSHPCPYVAYVGPVHPSSSNSSGNVPDTSNFNNHWNSDVPTSYGFPPMDLNYRHGWENHSSDLNYRHGWENHSSNSLPTPINRIGGGVHQPSAPPVTQRPARSSELSRPGSYMHPFLVGHSSSARAGNSVAPSPVIPPYQGSNARTRDRVQALQAYYQQHQPTNSRAPSISSNRRSNNHRNAAQIASSSDQLPGGYYYLPNNNTSGRSFQETENPVFNRSHPWERDYFSSFSTNQPDRDSGWGGFHQGGGGGSDHGIRPSEFRQRHGSERTSSQHR